MNICFCGHFTGGGTERATFLLANQLIHNHNVFIVGSRSNQPFFELNKRVIYKHLKSSNFLFKSFELFKYIKSNNIDLLISVEAMTGIYTLFAAKSAGCKHIIWEHANYYQTQGSKYIQKVRKLDLLIADKYVVLTKRDLNNFESNFNAKNKIEYIYNIAQYFPKHIYDIDSKTIISVGIVRDIKNFKVIPEIASRIFDKHPDWVWKIYGISKSQYAKELGEMIKSKNLENKVILCGQTTNMFDVYSHSSMCICTSKMEGLPMFLLESRMHGVPMISFDIETGPDEIIKDGVNGFLVPYNDLDLMTDRILALIENGDLRQQMSDMCRNEIEIFSEQVICKKWNDLINSI